MYRIIRTRTLHALRVDQEALPQYREEAVTAVQDAVAADLTVDRLSKRLAESEAQIEDLRAVVQQVTRERDDARAEQDQERAEVEAARAQVLLDAEDRVVLRALLRTARRQDARATRVYALFRSGALHSVHATADAAEAAAETEGAPRSGWTSLGPGAATPSAAEVPWRIQPLPLGGVQK
ncbi:hypothetical protein ACQRET_20335 [Streptomyces koyangensis]|uniref:Uncharacterized protein n=1 Tax=Streptomyces koyangensis TaxID=188770 RepID=A0A385DH94_9ACTN|nr:hypothetical protein [Streptomyces koyangensis]AXQ57795.1 hypothetical protein D0C37_26500 [Streptomyces koyangensis]